MHDVIAASSCIRPKARAPFARAWPAIAIGIVAVATITSPAQQAVVVPAAFADRDADSVLWMAGVEVPFRQQTLIGAQHLGALAGRRVDALVFRRDASRPQPLPAARVQFDLRVSTSAHAPLGASMVLTENEGPDAVLAFTGIVDVPAAPQLTAAVAPWDALHTIRIPFQVPFAYAAGPLCIDLTGDPVVAAGSSWPVDAVRESVRGSVVHVGEACGPYARAGTATAFAGDARLVAGATAILTARGAPGDPAFAAIGLRAVARSFDLSTIGAQPGCYVHLDPIVAALPAAFGPLLTPLAPLEGGVAALLVPVPTHPSALGLRFAAQWFELGSTLWASNALECTIASQPPSLGMATVTARAVGAPTPAAGVVDTWLAHVVRLETGN